jgi:hypothetical protein
MTWVSQKILFSKLAALRQTLPLAGLFDVFSFDPVLWIHFKLRLAVFFVKIAIGVLVPGWKIGEIGHDAAPCKALHKLLYLRFTMPLEEL